VHSLHKKNYPGVNCRYYWTWNLGRRRHQTTSCKG